MPPPPLATVGTPSVIALGVPVPIFPLTGLGVTARWDINKMFAGANGFHDRLAVTCSSSEAYALKKSVLGLSLEKILLMDSSKFGKDGVYLFSTFAERKIQTIITVRTDENADELERIEKAGITIIGA